MADKKQFKYFSIFDYEKEQEYLRNMHKSGWKFLKVTGLGMYHFEKCVPEDVSYQLDYNPDGLARKDEYIKMFNDCGWEYIQDFVGYSYFRKPVSDEKETEEIFCDEESRLQMMERVIKGRMLPLLIIFFCVLFPQFINSIISYHNYFIAAMVGTAIILYVAIFINCAIKYKKFKNSTKK
ncbi:MAG: DUF2812 domain-containing protein [Acutalibacteraceae bacterium]